MKIECPFCKTEYIVPEKTVRAVRCACCGKIWRAAARYGVLRRAWVFIAVAAIITLFVIRYSLLAPSVVVKSGLLSMTVHDAAVTDDGAWHARGEITNNSTDAYGVPNLRVKIGDTEKIVLSPVPILGAGESAEFSISGAAAASGDIKITFMEN